MKQECKHCHAEFNESEARHRTRPSRRYGGQTYLEIFCPNCGKPAVTGWYRDGEKEDEMAKSYRGWSKGA